MGQEQDTSEPMEIENNNRGSSGPNFNSDPSSTYANVLYKKVQGKVALTTSDFSFVASGNSSHKLSLSWSQIAKHQVSPASHPKALLKLVFRDGKSSTFQFSERTQLENIRKEISQRLQAFKTTHPSASTAADAAEAAASVSPPPVPPPASNKKRRISEVAMTPKHSKTTQTSFGELDPTALAVTRSSLLAANPTLRQQHTYLVQETETVSEEDFWVTHQDLLEEEYARISGMTRAGTSSLLQSHLQLLTGRVTLGVEEMRQIFILYPAVHKAYEEKVPLELSDEQFWRKYLESEYFHRDRGRIGAASRHSSDQKKLKKGEKSVEEQELRAAAVGTDDIFSRYDQKLREQNQESEGAKRQWGTKLAVGQFDLASTFETERGKLLEGPKDIAPAPEDEKGSKVIQKYNRHWAMVLHPDDAVAGANLMDVARKSVKEVLPEDTDADAGGGLDQDMRRLVGFAMASSENANHALGTGLEESDDYEPLTLKNIEVYHSTHDQSENANTEEDRKRRALFASAVSTQMQELAKEFDNGTQRSSVLTDALPIPKLGQELMAALTKKMAQDSQTDADALEVVKSLPDDFKKRLHSYFRRSSELLRHFFGLRRAVENQGNPSHNQKLQRIVQGMETVYREMESMRKELEMTDIGNTMRKMCLQIMDQLDWAFKLHREGSGGGGGGGFVTIESF